MQTPFKKSFLFLLAMILLIPLSKNASAQEEEESRDSVIRAAEFIINNVPPGALIVIEENALGPYWESLSKGSYLTLTIPKDEENPILVSPLYNLQWYGDLDLIVTTSEVSSFYRKGSKGQFPKQFAFYDNLALKWNEIATFAPPAFEGPVIRLFKSPSKTPLPDRPPTLFMALNGTDLTYVTPFMEDLGTVLTKARRYDRASQIFFHLTQLCKDCHEAKMQLGYVLAANEQFDKAIPVLSDYLRAEPDNHQMRFVYAYACSKEGKIDLAKAELQRVLKAVPDHQQAKDLLNSLP